MDLLGENKMNIHLLSFNKLPSAVKGLSCWGFRFSSDYATITATTKTKQQTKDKTQGNKPNA